MNFKNLSLSNKFYVTFIPLFVLLLIGFFIFYNHSLKSNLQYSTDLFLENQIHIFEKLVEQHQNNAVLISNLIAYYPNLKDIYLTPNPDESLEKLQAFVNPLIKKIVNNPDDFKIHFHKPPAISFYRSWTKKRGDDLSTFRKTILEVYKTKKPLKGIEAGVGGFAIRGIVPIMDGQNYLGSVEFQYYPEDLIKLLKTDNSQIGFFSMVDAEIAEKLFEKEALQKSFPSKKDRYYISEPSEKWIDINYFLDDKFFESTNQQTKIVIQNKDVYSVGILNVLDFSNQNVGKIVFVIDNTAQIQKIQNQFYTVVVATLILAIIFYFIFNLFINKNIKYPLEKAKELALNIKKGDLSKV